LEWWDILGLDSDKTVNDVKRMRLVEDDGVHLTSRANRCAALSLCIRVRENESESEDVKGDAGQLHQETAIKIAVETLWILHCSNGFVWQCGKEGLSV
jgi:hypothetical protein